MSMLRNVRSAASMGAFARRSFSTQSINKLRVKTFNNIADIGLQQFPSSKYVVSADHDDGQAIMLRSQKLTAEDIPLATRCIARCGAGTNNCQVNLMTERGVPVFNTPGSNANAVKELVLCALFLSSRGILAGAEHMQRLHKAGEASAKIETDKKMFGGQEVKGKTLGVVGLGHIGAAVAEAASALGMHVVAYDPHVSAEIAWKIDGRKIDRVSNLREIASRSDYVSIHVPFIEGVTENFISDEFFLHMKPTTNILNFARGGIVDSAAYRRVLNAGAPSKYICDFADDELWDHENVTILPHLGASTAEAEETSATMAAQTMRKFLETGCIQNSVNFPSAELAQRQDTSTRLCVANRNTPGVLSNMFEILSKAGLNIEQQYSTSNDYLGYHVIDFNKKGSGEFSFLEDLQREITMLPNVLNSRFIIDEMGQHFAVQSEGQFIV